MMAIIRITVKVKAQRRAALDPPMLKQQEHIRETEEYIRRYKAGIKAKQARGREKHYNRFRNASSYHKNQVLIILCSINQKNVLNV